MSVEPIGLVTLVLGFACLLFGPVFSIYALVPATLLGSAAALFLGSGGQVQPAHLLLAFVVPTALSRSSAAVGALRAIAFPRAGFWLLCLTAVAVAGAALLPRIFAGSTEINALGMTDYGPSMMLVPLSPGSGNITQSIYLLADLACFLTVVGACATRQGAIAVGKALVAYAALNVAFAALDLGTYYSNTTFLLAPIRNAQYALHLDEVTAGLKRIAGSFTEASSFSYATLGALGYTGTLWLHGRWTAWTGPLAALSLLLLILSTSSTAVVSGPCLLAVIYVTALRRLGSGRGQRIALAFVVGAPLLVTVAACAVALDDGTASVLQDFFNTLLFDKASSQSGLERASWNAAALQNFLDTGGLGAGLGSVRASSFLVAVPASLGVAGCALFAAFFSCVFFGPPGPDADLHAAARNGCLGLLLAGAVSGALVDLGLQFFILAGVACAAPALSRQRWAPSIGAALTMKAAT